MTQPMAAPAAAPIVAVKPTSPNLKPTKTTARYLLSSSARIIGGFEDDDYAVVIAHSRGGWSLHTQLKETPHTRNFAVVTVEHEEWEPPKVVAPNYQWVAGIVADVGAVWFGKQVEYHGELQAHGAFMVPDLRFDLTEMPTLGPYGHQPRKDLGVELNWATLKPVLQTVFAAGDKADLLVLAARHYNRALGTFNRDPEAAYVHLVTALEILAGTVQPPDEELYGKELLAALGSIATLKDGNAILALIKPRLYQIKRRVVHLCKAYAAPRLFEGTEAVDNHGPLQVSTFEACVKAAYDVRSRHLHAGVHPGGHILPMEAARNEMPMGTPVHHDAEMKKALAKAPTFLGLERTTRIVLLKFIHRKLGAIHPLLEADVTFPPGPNP